MDKKNTGLIATIATARVMRMPGPVWSVYGCNIIVCKFCPRC